MSINQSERPEGVPLKLLIIEDNEDLIENLFAFFEPSGYQLDCARSGYQGLALAAENSYDAIVLDISLPGMNGYTLCQKMRDELNLVTPVLMLTAMDSIENKLQGFDSGADDYLVKPFSLVELDARLKALIRRNKDHYTQPELRLGPLALNLQTHQVTRSGVSVSLTPIGYKILYRLLKEAPKVLSKEVLENYVWGESVPNSGVLRTHVHTIRQSLDKPFTSQMLKTLPGFGFQLVKPDE